MSNMNKSLDQNIKCISETVHMSAAKNELIKENEDQLCSNFGVHITEMWSKSSTIVA